VTDQASRYPRHRTEPRPPPMVCVKLPKRVLVDFVILCDLCDLLFKSVSLFHYLPGFWQNRERARRKTIYTEGHKVHEDNPLDVKM
jgi:hypothetical protein